MVVLYTTHCPKCKVLTKKLDQANIKYTICEDVQKMKEKGISAAPVLEVDGELYDFVSAVALVNRGDLR